MTALMTSIPRAQSGVFELAKLSAALKLRLENTRTLVISSLFIQTWGRVPESLATMR
jgi:hypothetical protein